MTTTPPNPMTAASVLRLTKHHGLGNDFLVLLDAADASSETLAGLAVEVCHRRTGIGADGLLVASHADGFDARMTLFNADGSTAEMSGNGIRCFAQALARDSSSLEPLRILTDAGERSVTLATSGDPDTLTARVEMGVVSVLPAPDGWGRVECHPDRPVAHLSLGNPHSVVGVDDVESVDLADLGGRVPHVNLEIVEPGPEADAITMRVHERGAGITAACGTGACAAAHAARSWGLVASSVSSVTVHMDGGTAVVSFDDEGSTAVLTGPTTFIATIEIPAP